MVPHSWAFGKIMPRGLALKSLCHHYTDLQFLYELSHDGLGGGLNHAQSRRCSGAYFRRRARSCITGGYVLEYLRRGIGNICCGTRALNLDHERRRTCPINVMTSERLIQTKPMIIDIGAAPKFYKNRGVVVETRAARRPRRQATEQAQ